MTDVVNACDPCSVTLLERIDAAIEYAKNTGRVTSARDAAERAGLSAGYFGKTRGDLKKNPSADLGAKTLASIARVCGVRPEWLSDERGPMVEPIARAYEDTQGHAINSLAESVTRYGLASQDLERVIRGERPWWKPGMTPEQIARVIDIAMTAKGKVSQPLPERYWFDFLVEACEREMKGETKIAPTIDRSDDLGGGKGDLPRGRRRK